jgi:hypothetical protein
MDETVYLNVFDNEQDARIHAAAMVRDHFDVTVTGPTPLVVVQIPGQNLHETDGGGSYFAVLAYNQT